MRFKFFSYLAWVQAVVATAGSLYASEIVHLPPCSLCWYQRVFMYPLVFIIAMGILKKDKALPFYVLPLSIFGMGFALYQFLLQRGILSDKIIPCGLEIPCTTKYVEWFGFVTIPLLSFLAFGLITGCMILIWKLKK